MKPVSQTSPTPAAPTVSPTAARRYTLQRKIILWTIAGIATATFGCGVWFNSIARQALADSHARNVELLANTLAASLTGDVQDDGSTPNDVFTGMTLDRRLAFVMITDAEGNTLRRRTVDAQAWATFERRMGKGREQFKMDTNRPIELTSSGDLIVYRAPVWSVQHDVTRSEQAAATIERELDGFVIVALHEPGLKRALARLTLMQLLAACVICLVTLPVVIVVLRHWIKPLRSLLEAIMQLSAGQSPRWVMVHQQDEIGVLASAFNNMAEKLFTAQQALQDVNAQLEEKVRQRTADLQRVNERLAEEIKDKDEFIRAISHDLGAPLRNIGGLATMLLVKYREQMVDDVRSKLERITANVKTQSDLIDDLLELSRLRSRPAKREQVDLNLLVKQSLEGLSYDIERAGIEFQLPDHLPTITVERNRMRQVFQNLFDNAVKYMLNATTKRITVTFEKTDRELVFKIADTGCGIAKEDLPRVFQVFHRSRHSGSHEVAGRGVGLATVKTIIEGYGGRISVDSELHKGTTVTFTLSRAIVEDMATEVTLSQAGPSPGEGPDPDARIIPCKPAARP